MIVTFESPTQENLTPKELRRLIAKKQSSGDDARYLIAPTPIELKADDRSQNSFATAQVGPKKAKNHVRANRKALGEMQRNKKDVAAERQAKETLQRQRQEKKKEKLYGKVRSRVFDPTAASNLSSPSDRGHHNSTSRATPFSSNSTSNEQAYHVAFGRKVPISASAPWANTSVESVASCTSRHHKSYGRVPAYITDRRAKIAQQEAERKMMQENAPPAPGLVLMEESERIQTLKMLDENEREVRESLRSIPFSMNHRKAARLREAIEFRLKEIEDTRKIFSKDKVFVAENSG